MGGWYLEKDPRAESLSRRESEHKRRGLELKSLLKFLCARVLLSLGVVAVPCHHGNTMGLRVQQQFYIPCYIRCISLLLLL